MPARRARRSPRGHRPAATPGEGLPIVALVGRPNVGKSTLFNRVVGERVAIVEDRARTTRDRLYDVAEWNGRRFIVVDTGGLEARPGDAIEERVQEQARLAIAEADVIVFLADAAAGPTPADQEASALLRTARKPVLLAVNKADNPRREIEAAEFHALGWEETYPISALHGRGTGDLLDAIVWALPPESEQELERKRREQLDEEEVSILAGQVGAEAEEAAFALDDRPARIAIVGRPNVGKSSLLNALLGAERAIVSDVPGTTRDAIDTSLQWAGREVRLIDTAGVRRRGKVAGGPAAERFATLRALKAVGRADVAVLVLDAGDGLTAQDAHVAGYVVDDGAGLVIAVNKWDLVEKGPRTFDEYAARIRREAPFIDFAPLVAISAKSGQRVGRVLESALDIAAERRRRVPTSALNALLREATFRQQPPIVRGRRPTIYYAAQVAIEPPTFVFFAGGAADIHFSYKRYLENRLRDAFGFAGTPIRLVFRERSRDQLEREPRRRRREPSAAASGSRGKATPGKTERPAREGRPRAAGRRAGQ